MTKKVSIFCQNSLYEFITNSRFDYKDLGNELEVIVDDVDHLDDELFCEHYGIDYNQINRIEALNFCAI